MFHTRLNTFRAYVAAWYDGQLSHVFFAAQKKPGMMRQVCSVLAGYVWDKSNPNVSHAERALGLLVKIINSQPQPASKQCP